MRVFVAGASDRTWLVLQLIERRHELLHGHRSPGGAERSGPSPCTSTGLTGTRSWWRVVVRRPDAIVHQATALADLSDFKHFDRTFHQTNLLRTAARTLIAAAQARGCHALRRPELRQQRGLVTRLAEASLTTGSAMSSAPPESLVEKTETNLHRSEEG